MRNLNTMLRPRLILGLVAVTVLALAPMAAAAAAAEDPQETTLTGMVSRNEAGRFVLVEEEGGNSVLLESAEPQTLADNEGLRVSVTGRWSASRETFLVSTVTPAPADPPAEAPTPPES